MAKDNSGSENFHYNNVEKKDKNFMYKNFILILILQLLEVLILKLVVLLREVLRERNLLELI